MEHIMTYWTHLYILCLSVWVSVCLFVWLYPINVKTAEPIATPEKVYEWSNFQKFASSKSWLSLNFENPRNFFWNPRIFFYYFTLYSKSKCLQLKQKMGAKRPVSLVFLRFKHPGEIKSYSAPRYGGGGWSRDNLNNKLWRHDKPGDMTCTLPGSRIPGT